MEAIVSKRALERAESLGLEIFYQSNSVGLHRATSTFDYGGEQQLLKEYDLTCLTTMTLA
jgi:hypothetical protein